MSMPTGVGGGQLFTNPTLDANDKALLNELSDSSDNTQSSHDQVILQALSQSQNLLSVEVAEALNSGNYSAAMAKKILDDIDNTPNLNNEPGFDIVTAMAKEETGATAREAAALDNYVQHSPAGPYLPSNGTGSSSGILLGPWQQLNQDPFMSLSDETALEKLENSTGSTQSSQDASLVAQLAQSSNVLAADIGKALNSGDYGPTIVQTFLSNLDADTDIHSQPGEEVLNQLQTVSYLASTQQYDAMGTFYDAMSDNHSDVFWDTSGAPY